ENLMKGLDSSVKKNSSFTKKLRSITEPQRDALTTEFNGLNLSRYIQEAVSIELCLETNQADVSCVAHICSLFHQRYQEFSDLLKKELVKVFENYAGKDEDRAANVTRYRVTLRLLGELILYGVFENLNENIKLLGGILNNIANCDKESHIYVQVIISFAKHCGEDFAGVLSRKHRALVEKHNITWPYTGIIPRDAQASFRHLLQSYYKTLAKHLLQVHKDLQNRERQNRQILLTKGELHADKKESLERAQKSYEKLLASTSNLADVLDEDMPDLPQDELIQQCEGSSTVDIFNPFKNQEYDGESGIWEDEDYRVFYENLKDLKASLPGILYKEDPRTGSSESLDSVDEKVTDKDSSIGNQVELLDDADEELNIEEDFADSDKEAEDTIFCYFFTGADESSESASVVTSGAAAMEALIAKLPTCVNKDMIDEVAMDFMLSCNNKKNRKKLTRAVLTVQRTRLDLLPMYSRLIATLDQCVSDISPEVVKALKGEFRFHVRKKDQINLESKIKSVRFIGELTKFQIFPKGDALHCLKMLLEDFSHHNIEMACNLLEVCGRFLYRSPDSHIRTKNLLEVMMRKKAVQNLDGRQLTMVDNAFYYCNPPERQKMMQKVRPPMHQYIRKLLYKDLSKTTTERVLRQIRKLPWDNTEIALYAIKCFIRIWNVKYNSIHCAANLLSGLSAYHEELALFIVDGVLEEIRLGMEVNHPKLNQRRVCCVRYLGELYNYRLVESRVIFNTLYSFLTFGNPDDGSSSELDPPQHLFRIRLICTLLDTCGQYFDHGNYRKKLDCFLVYFQLYINRKKSSPEWNESRPFPRDVDYMIADTLEILRPKLTVCSTLQEAQEQVEQLERDQKQQIGNSSHGSPHTSITGSPCPSPMPRDDYEPSESGESEQDDSEVLDVDDEYEMIDMEMDDDETAMHRVTRGRFLMKYLYINPSTPPKKVEPTAEDQEFQQMFERLMVDDLHSRRGESLKVPSLDVAVPMHLKGQVRKAEGAVDEKMNFVLMLRKGNKQQYRDLEIPISSDLAANMREKQVAEQAEQQELKRLVLDHNQRQEEEIYNGE
ncbi:predicted protein, partial [Nematostella vectensis]